MIETIYNFLHESWHICFYLIPSILVAVIMVIIGCAHWRKQNKREKEFEEQLEEKLNGNPEGAAAAASQVK